MALITCKDCKKEFSTDAKRCPHCGAKKPPKDRSRLYYLILILFLMLQVPRLFNSQDTSNFTAPPSKQNMVENKSPQPSPKPTYTGPVTAKNAIICDTADEVMRVFSYLNEGNQADAMSMLTNGCHMLEQGMPVRIVRDEGPVARVAIGNDAMFGYMPLTSIRGLKSIAPKKILKHKVE